MLSRPAASSTLRRVDRPSTPPYVQSAADASRDVVDAVQSELAGVGLTKQSDSMGARTRLTGDLGASRDSVGSIGGIEFWTEHAHKRSDALYAAASAGNVELVRQMLESGYHGDAGGRYLERTPLHAAAAAGHDAVIDVLLTYCDADAADICGRTPLHLAAAEGHLEAVRALLEGGADPRCTCKEGGGGLHYVARWSSRAGNVNDSTVMKVCKEICVELVQAGSALTLKDGSGKTPLDYTVRGTAPYSFLATLGDIRQLASAPSIDTQPALVICRHGNPTDLHCASPPVHSNSASPHRWSSASSTATSPSGSTPLQSGCIRGTSESAPGSPSSLANGCCVYLLQGGEWKTITHVSSAASAIASFGAQIGLIALEDGQLVRTGNCWDAFSLSQGPTGIQAMAFVDANCVVMLGRECGVWFSDNGGVTVCQSSVPSKEGELIFSCVAGSLNGCAVIGSNQSLFLWRIVQDSLSPFIEIWNGGLVISVDVHDNFCVACVEINSSVPGEVAGRTHICVCDLSRLSEGVRLLKAPESLRRVVIVEASHGAFTLFGVSSKDCYRSVDSGASWQLLKGPGISLDPRLIEGGRVVVGAARRGAIFWSADCGLTWNRSSAADPKKPWCVGSLRVNNAEPSLFGAVQSAEQ